MMFASLLLSYFTNFVYAPTPIKFVFSGAMIYCLFCFPINYIRSNDFDKVSNAILKTIIVLTVFAVIHSSVTEQAKYATGNKWITMFMNPECMFMMLAPCFTFLAADFHSVKILQDSIKIFLILGFFGVFVNCFILPAILWSSIIFFPFVNKSYKLMIVVSIAMAVFSAFFAEDTSRTSILMILFVLMAYWAVYRLKSLLVIKVVCFASLILSTFYGIMTLINPDFSVIAFALEYVLQKTADTDMATDTRTFLFLEMAEDLSQNDAWIFGKGAYSHYFSQYFYDLPSGEGDHFMRLMSEVTMLQNLLRGGILYASAYCSLIAYAVYKAITKGRSKFILSIAVVASGWYFVSWISYLHGCSFKQLGFFLLLGCCLSPTWLNKTDNEIESILKT